MSDKIPLDFSKKCDIILYMRNRKKNFMAASYTLRPDQIQSLIDQAKLLERTPSSLLRIIIDQYMDQTPVPAITQER